MKSLLSLFAVGLVASALLPTENAYALEARVQGGVKYLSDSLVNNLSCRNLSADNVYLAIKGDAFMEKTEYADSKLGIPQWFDLYRRLLGPF